MYDSKIIALDPQIPTYNAFWRFGFRVVKYQLNGLAVSKQSKMAYIQVEM